MVRKRILIADRVRQVRGSFAFIPHRFLSGGFLASLSREELLLYFFLVVASDKHGLSYYIAGDLIAFDSTLFQVLELPVGPAGGLR
ncbi:MAG: hypothetical protein JRJ37_12355 [Deltaproteobacteria bacterium]|nr:hypothetical protein [Deltaproteobacteria bacterium]